MEEIKELLKRNEELIKHLTKTLNKIYDIIVHENYDSYSRVKHIIEISKGSAPQRTKEWYELRGGCITASDISQVLSTPLAQSKVIERKTGDYKFFTCRAIEWGNKYEPVATRVYEQMFNVKIYDAPLLIHHIYPFIGASCDGFIIDEENKEGSLIEIKCPYSRQLGDKIPNHYLCQPKTQMEVTKVNKCNFFECRFQEITEDEFQNHPAEYKGIIGSYYYENNFNDDGELKMYYYYYEYNPDAVFEDELNNVKKKIETKKNAKYWNTVFWILIEHKNHVIHRDPKWLEDSIHELEKCWNKIVYIKNEKKVNSA